MTRRGRLAKLEARRGNGQGGGIFEADVMAGVWRERTGGGRTLPLSPEHLQEAEGMGGLLMIAPFYPGKVIAGVRWDDL